MMPQLERCYVTLLMLKALVPGGGGTACACLTCSISC